MASDLEKKIIKQVEYYFGDINLPRDKFLQEKIKEDEGWVSIEVLLSFKRLAALSTDQEVIAEALKKSETKLVVVSEDGKKVRRSPELPLPELNEDRKKELAERTAYAKGFPLDEQLDAIMSFLEPYGPIDSCQKRNYLDKIEKVHKFKGSCYIIFKDVETCKRFMEAESIKYKDVELIRKWRVDYDEEKKKEFEERKEKKNEKKQKNAEEKSDKVEKKFQLPKGTVMHFVGIKEDQTLTREEIKEKVKEVGGDVEVSYIDFNKGDLEGYIRLSKENDAAEFLKKLTEGKMTIGEIELTLKALEGEAEEEFLKKTIQSVTKQRQKNKIAARQNRKRRGNFGQGGARGRKAQKC